MNQLIRGAERSRCLLRVGRQAFSTSESSLAVGAQNLTQPTWQAESANRQSFPIVTVHRVLRNDTLGLNRTFSSLSAAADTVQSEDGQEQSSEAEERAPSTLEKAGFSNEDSTPGHAIAILQKAAAKGKGQYIRHSDFIRLCDSSRPGKQKDAKVIATALKEFKRNNRFTLQVEGSRAAVDGMLRSMKPSWKVQDGRPKVRAALFVAQQIVDETTGLYFAAETERVDIVLKDLRDGLLEMEENGFNLRIDDVGDEDDAEDKEEPSADEKLLRDALRLTERVVKSLLKRKSRPEWDMKKRAKRKYLKYLQVGSGPRHHTTMPYATEIALLIGGSAVAQETVVSPFADFKHTHSKKTRSVELFEMIKKAEELEEAQKSAEAAEAAISAEEAARKDEESSEEGEEQVEIHGGEGDTEEGTGPEEEKKD